MRFSPLFAVVFFLAFLGSVYIKGHTVTPHAPQPAMEGRVVISAPVQLLMYGGDRFLGANLEAMRIAATGGGTGESNTAYLIRAHHVVAELNACHEDNYYIGNALLSLGGAQDEGSELLRLAADCRFWDEYPPFFYGLNELFLNRNAQAAQHAIEEAAKRSTSNVAALKSIAIRIRAAEIGDERLMVTYLNHEKELASDPGLKAMLEKRIVRLEGLLLLREAQEKYENQVGRPLKSPDELLTAGILRIFPEDPLRIGYEFIDGTFRLGQVKIR